MYIYVDQAASNREVNMHTPGAGCTFILNTSERLWGHGIYRQPIWFVMFSATRNSSVLFTENSLRLFKNLKL